MGFQSIQRVVLEVGPRTVRRLGDPAGRVGDPVGAALAGIDDPVVLIQERPVAVADLWREVIEEAGGGVTGGALIVHPSWWPKPRVGRVVAAAAAAGFDPVAATTRCAFLAARVTGVIVEIDAEWVTIGDRSGASVLARRDVRGIDEALRRYGGEVFLDAAQDVDAQPFRGLRCRTVDLDAVVEEPDPPPEPRRSRRVAFPAAAALVVVAAVAAGAVHRGAGSSEEPVEAAGLVEGRVAVRVPPRWEVDRVTSGPGSRRVQVSSAADPDTALHITQSYAPEGTLADAAAALRRAVAAQPPGVFVDLRTGAVAGREAVTYREIRPGRVIRWSVLIDGATRIGIGCQSATGREDAVEAACAQAIGSARQFGTESGR